MLSLKEKFILVQLKTSHWTARKLSPKVTKEIDEAHNATDSGKFTKNLLISKQLEDINSCVGKVRNYHYKMTLPWDDDGQRLLPINDYLDYVAKIEEMKTEHWDLVLKFIKNYPDLRKERKKQLNTLFDEADYPNESELLTKFKIDYKFTPISDASDLRVDISKNEANEIKKNIEAGFNEKISIAKTSIIERAEKAVTAAYEKLSDAKATFRDSLIENISDIVDFIPTVNFDDDEKLIILRKKLKRLDVPIEPLRKDKTIRKETAKKCKKILKYIKSINYSNVVKVEMPIETSKTKTKRIR
jgi:hypothetical protein